MSSVQDFKQLVCQISCEDRVKLWPSVLKQQLGKENWKLDLFINLTSISPVSGLLQFSGICIIYTILFIWSLLSATSIMQILQSSAKTKKNHVHGWTLSNNTGWSGSWSQFDLNKSDICVATLHSSHLKYDFVAVLSPLPKLALKQLCGFTTLW